MDYNIHLCVNLCDQVNQANLFGFLSFFRVGVCFDFLVFCGFFCGGFLRVFWFCFCFVLVFYLFVLFCFKLPRHAIYGNRLE